MISRFSEEMGGRQSISSLRLLQPFGVLVVHRIDDVDERFVGVEQAVAAGQEIAFEPAFERVLAEHLHDAAIGSDVCAVGVFRLDLLKPSLQAGLIDILQPIGRVLVRAEHAEVAHVAPHDVAQKLAQRFGG